MLAFGMVPVLYLILIPLDSLWPLWDKENRALHDMLARTRVVRSPGDEDTEKVLASGEGTPAQAE